MPLTSLDPATALVVVDLQRGVVGLPTAHPIQEVIANAAALADAFRRCKLPVVLVNVAGRAPGRTEARVPAFPVSPEWFELVPELGRDPGDVLVTKYTWGAFHGTPLDLQLRRRRVTQLVLCSIATSIGVESTARAAFEHGYHVTLPVDAMTDSSPDAHRNSLERIFPRLGETSTTAEVLARLPA
jgi:nicotinamidase-related amidase